MSEQVQGRSTGEVSGWAVGFMLFAAILMMTAGIFQAIVGLAAILENEFYVPVRNYVFEFDVTAWGWIHLFLGIVVGVAGYAVMSGRVWARAVGITIAVLSAVANFFFIPYYPLWSMLIIALDVFVIWALAVYGRAAAERVGLR